MAHAYSNTRFIECELRHPEWAHLRVAADD
jgi:hypothetical protein